MNKSDVFEHTTGKKVISGMDALLHLTHELRMNDVHTPIILTDKIVVSLPFFKRMLSDLKENGYGTYICYDNIPADAPVSTAEEIARIFKSECCDGIIAVGGGSVLDCAKAVNLLVSKGYESLHSAMGMDHIAGALHPFIAVPTTSGTGSEATKVAVVSDSERNLKIEIITDKIIPTIAILDPDATLTLPAKVTASTGFDALTHAIEALYSLQANPISRAESFAAIELIVENIEKAVMSPKDRSVRLAMANGSYLAGAAFSNAMVGAVHAIGHAAGGVCHVPHGEIMAVLLPAVLEANYETIKEVLEELLFWIGGPEVFAATPANKRAYATIELIRELRHRLRNLCGLPESLTDLKISPDHFEAITEKALDDGAGITNPVSMSKELVLRVLEASL